eukprot:CAMPEP_0198340950 /NCGR_PEP_ID=MMETSP1450-20131203/46050_1 /TAXON_ID=753684 ORGANISM="Madagascaria erythrocladiodes, Strain CCMP3234" /NCGR_SAMPLE_ID=MMETSP1450 /ASSEMBLY_ACC=CAM_ASM_001115 /LENGTH=196 /DNA_ID=CAMNT_0044045945 /DNA_START=57 /DNA_END=644 /DNA_ORIENTATION=+
MASAARGAKRFAAWYARQMDKHPLRTNCLSGAALWFSGDMVAQRVFEKPADGHNWRRTASLTTFGLALAGPIYSWWYPFLDGRTQHVLARHGMMRFVALKIAADQLVFEPPFLALFFFSTGLMQGDSVSTVARRIKQDGVSTYLVDCCVWPAAQFVNFRYVPVMYQALVVNGVSVGWTTFLSWFSHRALESDDAPP